MGTSSRPVPPCKGCEDRTVGCHSVCERYQEYAAICEAIRKQRRLDRVALAPSNGQEVLGRKKLNDLKAGKRKDKR